MAKNNHNSSSIEWKDSYKVEAEKTPVIYRNKFLKEYERCKENNFEEDNIIFCYIFLQIYFECFFHFRLRKLVEIEFILSKPKIWNKWIDCSNNKCCIEKRYIQDKRKDGKLTELIKFFDLENEEEFMKIKKKIEKELWYITNIRNSLVHGHKIAEGSNFNEEEYKTPTKKYLTEKSLKEAIKRINNGGAEWNNLFNKLLPFLKTDYETIKEFKFEEIKI